MGGSEVKKNKQKNKQKPKLENWWFLGDSMASTPSECEESGAEAFNNDNTVTVGGQAA